MDTPHSATIAPASRDDDRISDPKTGGLEAPGGGRDDDDRVSDPKTGGLESPGG